MRLLVLVLYEYSPTRFACVRQTDPQKVYNGPRLPLRPATRLGLFGSGHFVRPRLRGARGQTAGEEACAAANCKVLTTNTLAILNADGTYMTDNPNVCGDSTGASCGLNSLWYYADECITSGYPIERLQASAGNSVGPATTLALACVSAAVAAFA